MSIVDTYREPSIGEVDGSVGEEDGFILGRNGIDAPKDLVRLPIVPVGCSAIVRLFDPIDVPAKPVAVADRTRFGEDLSLVFEGSLGPETFLNLLSRLTVVDNDAGNLKGGLQGVQNFLQLLPVADRVSEEQRSWNMSRIRGKDTKPEKIVRSILHRLGYRFRLHRPDLPGKPDIVIPRFRTVIFVHGCFWHRHADCRFAYSPKSRTAFWESKFRQTVERDQRNQAELESKGWKVLKVWECELRDIASLTDRLTEAIDHQQ